MTTTGQPQSWDLPVNERFDLISERLKHEPEFCKNNVPGLRDLLIDHNANDSMKREEFQRRLLQVFKNSTTDGTYSDVLDRLSEDEMTRVKAFVGEKKSAAELGKDFVVGPSLPLRDELDRLRSADRVLYLSQQSPAARPQSHLLTAALPKQQGLLGNIAQFFEKEGHYIKEVLQHEAEHIANLFHFGNHKKNDESAAFGDVNAVSEDDVGQYDTGALLYINAEFSNWGGTVHNTPKLTYVPSTVGQIELIVQVAKKFNLSVRCSGFRHSWSPIFGRDGEILISMLGIRTVTQLPNLTAQPWTLAPPNELEELSIAGGKPRTRGNKLVRIGCAATNERLRQWCIENKTCTIPLNVIMVEITLGGSNAPICHGAGRQNSTLSDLVRRIEYVDVNGVSQVVEKPEHLRAASGCFGLMGVVTFITMEFPPMSYAVIEPVKMPVIQAVPPPSGMDESKIPPALLANWTVLSKAQKQQCQADFERRATNDYYAEWFWFPYSDCAWVNTWNNTSDPQGVVEFPDNTHIFLSFIQTFIMNILQNAKVIDELVEITGLSEAAVTLISRSAMVALPEKKLKTWLPDALHFQRAIQNVRVRDTEVEMPLVARNLQTAPALEGSQNDIIDYAPVQQAWWDAILLAYAHTDTCPMRMPLEMRIMGASDVVMAPQRGNAPLSTCSIEVLTLASQAETWPAFAQQVIDKWMAIEDPNTGELLRTRPHWAKEWHGYSVGGRPWVEKLKNEDYLEERKEFVRILGKIGEEAGWTLADLKKRFSNDLFDDFFFDDVGVVEVIGQGPVIEVGGPVLDQKSALPVVQVLSTGIY